MASAGPAKHPHADAKYQICRREAMGYAVEVAIPGMNPTMVSGFITEQQAASWIAEHRQRVASGPLRLRRPSIPPPAVGRVAETADGQSRKQAMPRAYEPTAGFRCFCGEPAVAFRAYGNTETCLCPVHLSLSDPLAAEVYAKVAHLRKRLPPHKMN
jgi:hypothetical protein